MFSATTRKFAIALFAAFAFAVPAAAQEEGEAKVIDEVIAQVNGDIITLGQLRREMRQATEALARTGNLTEEQARAEVQKRSGEMVANLITEQLVVQQGKELNYETRVEEELNRRLVSLAKEQNIPFSQLDDAMRSSGVDPAGFRADARRGIMTGLVFNEEVDRRVYESLTPAEVRKYFDQNQAKFRTPETMTLSEIFLSKAGKSETEVRALADRLVREARAGKDFGELAAANSNRESTRDAKGKIGTLAMSQIEQGRPEVVSALKALKVGGVTDPIPSDEGFLILRLDERAASGAPVFNEQQVRVVMTEERSTKERVAYLAKLRSDAYLKIADGYRAAVEEALDKQSRPEPAASSAQPTTQPNAQPATTQPAAAQPARRATPANVAPAGRQP